MVEDLKSLPWIHDPWMVSREAAAIGMDRDSIGLKKAGAGGMYGIWEFGGELPVIAISPG